MTLTACLANDACMQALIDAANGIGRAVGDALNSAKEWVKNLLRFCKKIRFSCRLSVHPVHHWRPVPTTTFPFVKKCWMNHVQVDCWILGVPFSNVVYRDPFGPCCKFKNCAGGVTI